MKVLVLGSGVIGVSAAYQLALAGHEVVVVDRQPAPALETSFANAGEVSPGYSAPWAGPGVPLQGHQVAADAPSAARHSRQPRHRAAALGPGDAAQLHGRPLRSQQGPHDAAGRVQPRLPGCAASQHRHHLRRTHARHAAAVSHPQAVRWQRRRHRGPAAQRRRLPSCSTRPAASSTSPRWRRCARSSSVACCCPATRPATASSSRSGSPSSRPSEGVTFRQSVRIESLVRSGARLEGVQTDAGRLVADAYLRRARQLFAAAAAAARHPHPGLSGQGLLDHGADRRSVRRARIDGDGRDPQGRGDAPRRPDPRRRHGRARRLHAEAARGAPPHARARRRRPLSARRRSLESGVLVRPAADDAGRHADRRADRDRQPLPGDRPRDARLDHGRRHRAGDRRPDVEAHAGDRSRRSHPRTLSTVAPDRRGVAERRCRADRRRRRAPPAARRSGTSRRPRAAHRRRPAESASRS